MKQFIAALWIITAVAGCSIVGKLVGSVGCSALPEKQQDAMREIVLPNLIVATPAQRRVMLESSRGLVALYAPKWFGDLWQGLHGVFRESTDATVQGNYDKAVDDAIDSCAASLGVVA